LEKKYEDGECMLIGLVGFINCGKGTIADILVDRHDFVKESYANSVKDACATIFGWNRSMLEGDTPGSRAWREQPDAWWSEKFGREFSPRLALQLMGTEAGRDVFHPDLWVHTVMRRCEQAPWNNYVIADVRFPNEIDAIVKSGGKVIRVRRGDEPEWYSLARECNHNNQQQIMRNAYPEVHYSEWAWVGSHYDIVMDNNCSLDELTVRVDKLVDSLYNNRVEANEVVNYETF
jgi:hypothetical protein